MPGGQQGIEAEIFLYDTLSGGAGFTRQVGVRFPEVFAEALRLLESCPDRCDRSCYRCLRSYKNKFDHDLLDRRIGSYLMRYLATGVVAPPDRGWVDSTTDLLLNDLERQVGDLVEFSRSASARCADGVEHTAPILARRPDGSELVIGVLDPLTDSYSSDLEFQALITGSIVPVWPVEEVVARRNLPWVSSQLVSELTE
jgi:hypothetical protein